MPTTPIVEVGQMGIQPGKTPMDRQTADGKLLSEAWTSIIAAPGGPERIFWGVEKRMNEKEDAEQGRKLWGWFDWQSLGAHEEFAKSFGGKATSRFGEVFTPGFTKHAFLSTNPLRSPTTQIVVAFFPSTVSQEAKDGVTQSFERLRTSNLEKRVESVSGGWGMETDFPTRGRRGAEKEGSRELEKGAVFFVLVGWERVDDKAREEVRENVALVLEMEGCVAWDEFCLECEVLERAGGHEQR